MDVLAVVGSQHWPEMPVWDNAVALVEALYTDNVPDLVVSGGAPGIDSLAVRLAEAHHIPYRELPPRHHRWEPDGFKERNIKIAQMCTRLVVIRHSQSRTFGSGWTAQYAARIGRPTSGWVMHPDGRVETYQPREQQTPTETLF